ncbi:MAG: outer membrane protein assembly factor BamD [Gammaproteobacteria bacterium]
MKLNRLILLLGLLFLAGCSSSSKEDMFKGMTENQIYTGGQKALAKGHYSKAAQHFEALQANYPFGEHAEQIDRNIIYAYYKNGDAASAIAAADRYIHLYPQSSYVDYAYYMKGRVNFDRGRTHLQEMVGVNPAQRDLKYMNQAFNAFNDLLQQYPHSPYSPDARQRMIYIRNLLAQQQLEIAQFYFTRQVYVAAANRASLVVRHYEGAPQVIPALVLMVKSYRALGLTDQANDALQVLQYNYPTAPELKSLLQVK